MGAPARETKSLVNTQRQRWREIRDGTRWDGREREREGGNWGGEVGRGVGG